MKALSEVSAAVYPHDGDPPALLRREGDFPGQQAKRVEGKDRQQKEDPQYDSNGFAFMNRVSHLAKFPCP